MAVCICVCVCACAFCFVFVCVVFLFLCFLFIFFTVVRSLMVRPRRCNPLIAACNCSIGNVHGPLRWSPLTASVACPGVNWYSRVGGTLYHIQGAGASGFEGLGVCRGLVAAPAAKGFERPIAKGSVGGAIWSARSWKQGARREGRREEEESES